MQNRMVSLGVAPTVETEQADIKAFRIILRTLISTGVFWRAVWYDCILLNQSIACSPLCKQIGPGLAGEVLEPNVSMLTPASLDNGISDYGER